MKLIITLNVFKLWFIFFEIYILYFLILFLIKLFNKNK